ncbi:hypothetical protein, partial [Escherichia coli]|uniref:hypothetical protein n=1 Tax=Escherichia coli TaxID=562 RepID=UPI002280E93A
MSPVLCAIPARPGKGDNAVIGDFDSILSDEEAQRLESAFQALGAASANGERSVSEAEERAWFAHLQQG